MLLSDDPPIGIDVGRRQEPLECFSKAVFQTAVLTLVPVIEVETRLLHIVLPADNIFGLDPGTQGLSVALVWVALLHPLTPGTHTIILNPGATNSITATIVVKPGG